LQLVCRDIAVNRQCDSDSDLLAVPDLGFWGHFLAAAVTAAVVWGPPLHHSLPAAQEGAGSRLCAAETAVPICYKH